MQKVNKVLEMYLGRIQFLEKCRQYTTIGLKICKTKKLQNKQIFNMLRSTDGVFEICIR